MAEILNPEDRNQHGPLRGQDHEESSHLLISHYPSFNQQEPEEPEQDDVEELKNRISQLEHLVITSTLSNSAFLDPSVTRLTPHGLIQRVSHLESILAASELDNQRLEREVELLKASKQEIELDFYRSVKDKDARIKNLEHDVELLNVRLTKAGSTIISMEEYIHTLPSQQELDDANAALSKSDLEVDQLQNKVEQLQISLQETRKILSEKETIHSKALRRLEELQPVEEAQISILEGLQSETNLVELATIQKTQLLKATKIIKAQRRSICDLETERSELLLQLSERCSTISALESIVTASQYQLENTVKQLKVSEDEKRQLGTHVQELETQILENENWIRVRQNEMSNLLRLVTEVDFTITDLRKLIVVCQNLTFGNEPSLEDMLGLQIEDDDDDPEDLIHEVVEKETDGDLPKLDVDLEWILERLKLVREARENIKDLRTQVNEIYTDILGSGGGAKECGIQ